MTRTILVGISLTLVAACGEVEQSVNPSDLSTAGTAAAVLSSAGLDDLLEDAFDEQSEPAPSTACQTDNVTITGTIDGQAVDFTSSVFGWYTNQLDSPKVHSFQFDGGNLWMFWTGEYIELAPQEVAGTLILEGEQYCLDGAVLAVTQPWASVQVTGLSEYISDEECGAFIPADLEICADMN